MNRYEIDNAVEKVDGYFLPKPEQRVGCQGGVKAAFESAQAECLLNLRSQIANIEALTFDQFAKKKKL